MQAQWYNENQPILYIIKWNMDKVQIIIVCPWNNLLNSVKYPEIPVQYSMC